MREKFGDIRHMTILIDGSGIATHLGFRLRVLDGRSPTLNDFDVHDRLCSINRAEPVMILPDMVVVLMINSGILSAHSKFNLDEEYRLFVMGERMGSCVSKTNDAKNPVMRLIEADPLYTHEKSGLTVKLV